MWSTQRGAEPALSTDSCSLKPSLGAYGVSVSSEQPLGLTRGNSMVRKLGLLALLKNQLPESWWVGEWTPKGRRKLLHHTTVEVWELCFAEPFSQPIADGKA